MLWEAATIATPTVAGVFADATAFGVWAAAHADDADALHTLVHITDLKATYFITAVSPAITGVLVGETQFPYVTYADAAAFAAATPTIDVLGKVARVADTDSFYYCKVHGATPQWVSLSPVTSVFGRTGAVTAQNGDYTAAQVGADAAGSAAAAVAPAQADATQALSDAAAAQADATAALGSASMDGTVDVMGREALTEVPGMVVDTTLRGQFKFLEVTADAQSFPLSLSGGVDCQILIQAYPSYTPGGSDTVNILGYTFKVDSHLGQMLLEHTQTAGGVITNTRVLRKSLSLPVLTQALADAVTSLAGLAHVTSPVLELDNSALTGPLASYDLSTASGPWRTLHGEVLVKLVGSTAHGITNFDGTGTALAVGEGVLIRGSSPSTQQYLKVVMM